MPNVISGANRSKNMEKCVHKCENGKHVVATHPAGNDVAHGAIEHEIMAGKVTCPECDWAATPVYGTAESGLVWFAEFTNPVQVEDRVQHGTKLGLLRWGIYDGAINGLDVPNHWLAI
jgi:hypothetical protein